MVKIFSAEVSGTYFRMYTDLLQCEWNKPVLYQGERGGLPV